MHQDLSSDQELARRALGGDEESWRRIYESTCDHLFSLLCYQIGDRDQARDLLQETYLRAFRSLHRYRGEGPLAAWLQAIAIRKALDWKRVWVARLKRTVPETDSLPAPLDEPTVHFESEKESLHQALARLTPGQRAALLLREWEEKSFAEIASLLGCSESTARVHHLHAREKLRRLLAGASSIGQKEWEGQRT